MSSWRARSQLEIHAEADRADRIRAVILQIAAGIERRRRAWILLRRPALVEQVDREHADAPAAVGRADADIAAEQAERRVRAYIAYPKTKVTIAGHLVVVTKAHLTSERTDVLDVECSDGRFLRIDELISPSGRAMDAKAFLNGYAAG